jgi:hypothetical protein
MSGTLTLLLACAASRFVIFGLDQLASLLPASAFFYFSGLKRHRFINRIRRQVRDPH